MIKLIMAKYICKKYHKNQKDKANKKYYLHPFEVAKKLKFEDEKIIAILHDILEDTECPPELILNTFGNNIYNNILTLTHKKNEPYDEYIKRVKQNPVTTRVKLADINHNMDLLRLNSITYKDRQRMKKYISALQYLLEI